MRASSPQQSSETLLTKKQFAAKLGHTERTIDRHLQQGVYPEGIKVTIGGSVRFRESVADRWIADGCPGAVDAEQKMNCSVGECNRPAQLYHHDGGSFAFCRCHAVGEPVGD